jgi:superfamily I DNA/RNA helicase
MQRMTVIGAAGTGKTHLLLESVLHLPERDRILILTSSSRMADELRSRIRDSAKASALSVTIHTVRSLCESVLRENELELYILSDFRAWFVLRECIRSGSVSLGSSYARVKNKHSFTSEMLELIQAARVSTPLPSINSPTRSRQGASWQILRIPTIIIGTIASNMV